MDNDKLMISAEKIIEKSRQWSLEGDCSLLQWMDQISKNLEDRVTKTSSALNNLTNKLDRTSVALSNVTNNLAALQYSQFVENRVHDDDETLANVAEVPNLVGDVTDHKDENHDIYSFLKKNLEMMNSCHEAYSISYDDSDDDEPATNVIYRSKNPYEARSLPHIYGSTPWKEKWHIGLCDSDNDFSGDEQSEQFSESSSSADDSYESTAPTMSEWDSTAWGLNKNHLVEREDIHTPSNDGESSYQGEIYSQSEVSTPRAQQRSLPISQPVQEQRYYQHVPRKQENLFDDIFTDSEQQVAPPPASASAQVKISPEVLISDEPPPDIQANESDNTRQVGAKKTLNLFDDDEFSSFMDQIVQTANSKNTRNSNPPGEKVETPKKAVVPNLFEDSDELFIPKASEPALVTRKEPAPKLEDDIFMPPPLPSVAEKIRTRNLFDDDDDDDDFESMFAAKPGRGNKSAEKTKNLFDDEVPPIVEKVSVSITKEKSSPFASKTKDLFDDDSNDESTRESQVSAVEKVVVALPKEPGVPFVSKTKNLFEDDSNDEYAKESQTPVITLPNEPVYPSLPTKMKDLVEDDITQESTKASPVSVALPNEQEVPKEAIVKEVPLMRKGLFDDDDEDDLDEDDIFAKRPLKKDLFENIFSKDDPIKNISVRESLFDDEDNVEAAKYDKTAEDTSKAKPTRSSVLTKDLFADFFGDEPADDSCAQSSGKQKTKVADIFADDFTDDFEEFLPKAVTSKVDDFTPVTLVEKNAGDEIKSPVAVSTTKQLDIARKPSLPVIDKRREDQVIPAHPAADEGPTRSSKLLLVNENTNEEVKQTEAPRLPEISRKPIFSPIDKNEPAQSTSENKLAISQKSSEPIERSSKYDAKPADEEVYQSVEASESEKDADLSSPSGHSAENIKNIAPNTFEDTPAQNTEPPEINAQPTTAVPSYTSLFHDEPPPDDDEDQSIPSYEEPAKYSGDDEIIISTPPVAPYSNINLFADVPPDDDDCPFAAPPTETKRIHSIFYDDFHETIEASRGETRAASTYIFNDEPPPDDDLQGPKLIPADKPKVVQEKKDKAKVSKLKKTDLQINVGALLPSAKIPSFKKAESVVEPARTSPKDDYVPSKTIYAVKSPDRKDLPENILPNLNRDRAKVQVKRRPSTRRGRQESYRKSVIENEKIAAEQEKNGDDEQSNRPKSDFADFGTLSPVISKEEFPTTTTTLKSKHLFEEPTIFNKKSTDSLEPKTFKSSTTTAMFAEPPCDAGNIFETLRSDNKKPIAEPEAVDSLFDDVDENPFGTPKKSFTDSSPQKTQTVSQISSKTAKSVSLFEEFDPAEENQEGTTTAAKNPLKPAEEPAKPSAQPVSIFGESDDGSDDLFKDSKTPKKPAPQKTIDKKPKAKTVSQSTKPSSSLFSSDEENVSGDDIFGKSKTKATPKKLETAKVKPSSSLFADLSDDDDDDLFGTTKKKLIGVDKSKSKPSTTNLQPTKASSAQAQQQAAISNNPLSDLLGP